MPLSPVRRICRQTLTALMEHLPVGLMLASTENLEIVSVSDTACQFLRRSRAELEHKPIEAVAREMTVISPNAAIADVPQFPIARACLGEVVRGEQWTVEYEDGQRRVAMVNTAPIRDEDGHISGGLVAWTDITALKAVEQGLHECIATEAMLLRESNHRIKNHLQILAGLVQIHALRPGITAHELAALTADRLSVLAAAHEGFYTSDNAGSMNAAHLLERVVQALNSPRHPIVVACPPDIDFNEFQVTPVALAVNEGICNALKHAFPDDRPGGIAISLTREAGMVAIDIVDEGKGLPDQGGERGLGTKILGTLARQLNGVFTLENYCAGGAVARLRFPEASRRRGDDVTPNIDPPPYGGGPRRLKRPPLPSA